MTPINVFQISFCCQCLCSVSYQGVAFLSFLDMKFADDKSRDPWSHFTLFLTKLLGHVNRSEKKEKRGQGSKRYIRTLFLLKKSEYRQVPTTIGRSRGSFGMHEQCRTLCSWLSDATPPWRTRGSGWARWPRIILTTAWHGRPHFAYFSSSSSSSSSSPCFEYFDNLVFVAVGWTLEFLLNMLKCERSVI